MNIKTISCIALLALTATCIIAPSAISIARNKANDVLTKTMPVEVLQQKHEELTKRYIQLNKRLYIIDNKIQTIIDTIAMIEKSNKTGQSVDTAGNVIVENPVAYSNCITRKKCLEAMVKSKDKLVAVNTKYESVLKNYRVNIEIIKNKKVLQETMAELNSYMREFNIDSVDLSMENILNNTTALDEIILEEEAEYDALNKLSEFENEM
jgi:lipopolysaccharide export LptBFGC system permease protein LptF